MGAVVEAGVTVVDQNLPLQDSRSWAGKRVGVILIDCLRPGRITYEQ